MPQTEKGKQREPQIKGGERDSQEAGNAITRAAVEAREGPVGRGLDFAPGVVLDPSEVEFRADQTPGITTLGGGPGREGQTERPLTNDEGGPGDPAQENRLPGQYYPEGVELADPWDETQEPMPDYANEDEEFLFGMTDRPDEAMIDGSVARKPQPPKDVYRYLGALADAAGDPNSPPELHAYMRILQELLSE